MERKAFGMEEWRDIQSWEGIYQVSDRGRIKSFKGSASGRILSNTNKTGWYLSVVLQKGSRRRSDRIHRLVAEAFIPNPFGKPEVNHIDGNKQNNCVENLEWCTHGENLAKDTKRNPGRVSGMVYYNTTIKPKRIIQKTMAGKVVASHLNGRAASIATGICHRNILQVAAKSEYAPGKTRRQSGGFMWSFAHEC